RASARGLLAGQTARRSGRIRGRPPPAPRGAPGADTRCRDGTAAARGHLFRIRMEHRVLAAAVALRPRKPRDVRAQGTRAHAPRARLRGLPGTSVSISPRPDLVGEGSLPAAATPARYRRRVSLD